MKPTTSRLVHQAIVAVAIMSALGLLNASSAEASIACSPVNKLTVSGGYWEGSDDLSSYTCLEVEPSYNYAKVTTYTNSSFASKVEYHWFRTETYLISNYLMYGSVTGPNQSAYYFTFLGEGSHRLQGIGRSCFDVKNDGKGMICTLYSTTPVLWD